MVLEEAAPECSALAIEGGAEATQRALVHADKERLRRRLRRLRRLRAAAVACARSACGSEASGEQPRRTTTAAAVLLLMRSVVVGSRRRRECVDELL